MPKLLLTHTSGKETRTSRVSVADSPWYKGRLAVAMIADIIAQLDQLHNFDSMRITRMGKGKYAIDTAQEGRLIIELDSSNG